jgi:hypothetical protein
VQLNGIWQRAQVPRGVAAPAAKRAPAPFFRVSAQTALDPAYTVTEPVAGPAYRRVTFTLTLRPCSRPKRTDDVDSARAAEVGWRTEPRAIQPRSAVAPLVARYAGNVTFGPSASAAEKLTVTK